MTIHVVDKNNCTKASFTGIPEQLGKFVDVLCKMQTIRLDDDACLTIRLLPFCHLVRCIPREVSFLRGSRRLMVNLTWKPEDNKHIATFALRYRVLNSGFWNEVGNTHQCIQCTTHLLLFFVPISA